MWWLNHSPCDPIKDSGRACCACNKPGRLRLKLLAYQASAKL